MIAQRTLFKQPCECINNSFEIGSEKIVQEIFEIFHQFTKMFVYTQNTFLCILIDRLHFYKTMLKYMCV